ncbi:MAG: hypothetical protein AAFQ82_19735, partial [Myxococcota bacterium]
FHETVSWNRSGDTQWQESNARKLCKGVRYPQPRIDCFSRQVSQGRNWDGAVASCQREGLSPPQNLEKQCYNMVQGNVAWNRSGNRQWQDRNLKEFCQGVRDPGARISCFQRQIDNGTNWSQAIQSCRRAG